MKDRAVLKEILIQLDKEQLDQVRLGMKNGVDADVYLNPAYMPLQMQWIRIGLEKGMDVSAYANPEFDWFQMEEICKGLEAGVDVSKYASVQIPYERMRQIREGLEVGIDLSPFGIYGAPELRELRLALMDKVHITNYMIEGYDAEQLKEIREALRDRIDITPYLSIEYRGIALHEIVLGIRKHLDVEQYAKIYYSWQQMREIREGLEERLDVSMYLSPLYSASQMHEIRLGLLVGLDVTEYRSFQYTAKDMKKKRMAMIRELTADGNRKMIPGEDGYHEYLFEQKNAGTHLVSDEDIIDYDEVYRHILCEKEEVIAIYHPATKGVDGISSDGGIIRATKGKEKKILFGRGIAYSDTEKTYTATETGWIFLNEEDSRLEVRPVITLDSVDPQDDVIKIKGTVEVLGNVKSGVQMEVDGDLIVDGHVENAVISCTGNLIVRNGINGGGKAIVSVGKDLICRYFENCSASAKGEIRTDYIFDSQVFSLKKVIAAGNKGSIIGSEVFAVLGISCDQAGNASALSTTLTIDLPYEYVRENELFLQDRKKLQGEMQLMEQALEKYKDTYSAEERNANPAFLKVEKAIFTYKMELQKIETQLQKYQDLIKAMERSKIVVRCAAFENVTMKIAEASLRTEDLMQRITVSKSGDKLLVKN